MEAECPILSPQTIDIYEKEFSRGGMNAGALSPRKGVAYIQALNSWRVQSLRQEEKKQKTVISECNIFPWSEIDSEYTMCNCIISPKSKCKIEYEEKKEEKTKPSRRKEDSLE